MGILWLVKSLDDEIKSWLDEIGIKYPHNSSRLPKGQEVKDVLENLSDFNIEINDNGIGSIWQASIVSKLEGDYGQWTLLNIDEYSGDGKEQKLWFEKGWESLITSILKELSIKSGPLVLIPDTGDDPVIIYEATV